MAKLSVLSHQGQRKGGGSQSNRQTESRREKSSTWYRVSKRVQTYTVNHVVYVARKSHKIYLEENLFAPPVGPDVRGLLSIDSTCPSIPMISIR